MSLTPHLTVLDQQQQKKTWKKYVVVGVVAELNCGGGVLNN